MNHRITISWILQIITSAILLMAAIGKLTGKPEPVALFQQLNFDPGGRILIGVLELLAALIILIPQSIVIGAILGWGLMSGALIAHFTRLGFDGMYGLLGMMAAAIWVGCAAIMILRHDQSRLLSAMFTITNPERASPPGGTRNDSREPPDTHG